MRPALLALISKVLTEAGRTNQAAQISKLFTAYLGNNRISVGLAGLNSNLTRARVIDAQNVEKITVQSAFGLKPQWPDLAEKRVRCPRQPLHCRQEIQAPKHPPQ